MHSLTKNYIEYDLRAVNCNRKAVIRLNTGVVHTTISYVQKRFILLIGLGPRMIENKFKLRHAEANVVEPHIASQIKLVSKSGEKLVFY